MDQVGPLNNLLFVVSVWLGAHISEDPDGVDSNRLALLISTEHFSKCLNQLEFLLAYRVNIV